MFNKNLVKHAITSGIIAALASGCATKTKVDEIASRLDNHSVRFISELHEESYKLQRQIELQREKIIDAVTQIERLEQKLHGIRFRITPTVIQLLHDYDELEHQVAGEIDAESCPELIESRHMEAFCNDSIVAEQH